MKIKWQLTNFPPVCWPFIAKAFIQLFTYSTRAHILIKELSYPLLVIQSLNKNSLQSYPGTHYQVKNYLIHSSCVNFPLQSRTNVMQFSLMTFHR